MLAAFLALLVVCIISWILTCFHVKYKGVALIFTFLSIVLFVLGIIEFASGYNPLTSLKEAVITSIQSDQAPTAKPSPPIEVLVPKATTSAKGTDDSELIQPLEYITRAVILNVGKQMYRRDDGDIQIVWTPIAGQNEYRLRLKVDDPFSSAAKEREYTTDKFWYNLDVSEYENDTVMFVSVGIWDDFNSEWVFSDYVNFILN